MTTKNTLLAPTSRPSALQWELEDAGRPERLLRLQEVLALLQVSRSTWYKGMAAGIYPRPVRIGARSVRWRHADIMALRDRGIA